MGLKIWYVSAYDAPEGQSSRTYDFATELSSLGHHVTMFTSSYNHFTHTEYLEPHEKWKEEWFGRVRVVWLKTIPYRGNDWRRGLNMLSNAWQAFRVGGKWNEQPDIIFGPSVPILTGLAAYLLSRKKGSLFCFEVRDIWPQALIDLGVLSERSPVTWLFRTVERFLYERANKIITVLPFAYRHICKYGVPLDKILWIPNGVKFSRFSNCAPYDGGKPASITVTYVGGLSTTHDIDVILNALNSMPESEKPRVRCIIVGIGQKRRHYEHIAKSLAFNNIEFRDAVAKKDVPSILGNADVLIASVKNTPVYQFGINSNKIFDYLGAGRPIIFAGNSPNNPVADADAGITVPPEDPASMSKAISTFLRMPQAERKRLGDHGFQYAAAHLDTRILARKIEAALINMLQNSKCNNPPVMKNVQKNCLGVDSSLDER